MNPINAPWIIFARPGTFIETRHKIVKNERSFKRPQMN
jgi:hypothetical protein